PRAFEGLQQAVVNHLRRNKGLAQRVHSGRKGGKPLQALPIDLVRCVVVAGGVMGRRFKSLPQTPLTAALEDLRKTGGALLIFSLCPNLLLLTSPIYMMQVFDRVLSSGRAETLLFLTIIAVIAMAVLGTLETARGRVLSRAAIWLERRIAPDLIAA